MSEAHFYFSFASILFITSEIIGEHSTAQAYASQFQYLTTAHFRNHLHTRAQQTFEKNQSTKHILRNAARKRNDRDWYLAITNFQPPVYMFFVKNNKPPIKSIHLLQTRVTFLPLFGVIETNDQENCWEYTETTTTGCGCFCVLQII